MKKILNAGLFLISLSVTSISAGIYCIDNEEHSLECPCNCDVIKGRHCIDCMHLQDARPLNMVQTRYKELGQNTENATIRIPDNPQNVLKKLAAQYVKNKYDI